MKTLLLLTLSLLLFKESIAQNIRHYEYALEADSLYQVKNFKKSALFYSKYINSNAWKVSANTLYDASCSWALSPNPDSAFYYLTYLVKNKGYSNQTHINGDSDLFSLHTDNRWAAIINLIKENSVIAEKKLNKPLMRTLDSVENNDQQNRKNGRSVINKFGEKSIEAKNYWEKVRKDDSVNLIVVTNILDKYGWLGADVVGAKGNLTFFLIIQHSNLQIQKKYLPIMERAVEKGLASSANLALLEDRILVEEDKKQIYGSQVTTDLKTGKPEFSPIEDEKKVNERRLSVGLQPIADYAKLFGIIYKSPIN